MRTFVRSATRRHIAVFELLRRVWREPSSREPLEGIEALTEEELEAVQHSHPGGIRPDHQRGLDRRVDHVEQPPLVADRSEVDRRARVEVHADRRRIDDAVGTIDSGLGRLRRDDRQIREPSGEGVGERSRRGRVRRRRSESPTPPVRPVRRLSICRLRPLRSARRRRGARRAIAVASVEGGPRSRCSTQRADHRRRRRSCSRRVSAARSDRRRRRTRTRSP